MPTYKALNLILPPKEALRKQLETPLLFSEVTFREEGRDSKFGVFVRCKDSEELALKGMLRFVQEDRLENFIKLGLVSLTRILAFNTILNIKLFTYE